METMLKKVINKNGRRKEHIKIFLNVNIRELRCNRK
jgi:hypothetical protein